MRTNRKTTALIVAAFITPIEIPLPNQIIVNALSAMHIERLAESVHTCLVENSVKFTGTFMAIGSEKCDISQNRLAVTNVNITISTPMNGGWQYYRALAFRNKSSAIIVEFMQPESPIERVQKYLNHAFQFSDKIIIEHMNEELEIPHDIFTKTIQTLESEKKIFINSNTGVIRKYKNEGKITTYQKNQKFGILSGFIRIAAISIGMAIEVAGWIFFGKKGGIIGFAALVICVLVGERIKVIQDKRRK
jgi:hypothetical protein